MNALVTVIWQEIPESTKIFTIATRDKDEYDLLMSFHGKYINHSLTTVKEKNSIIEYFYDKESDLRFIDESKTCPIEMLGVEGVKFAVICTGIYL